MIEAVIFDVDGTLLDSNDLHALAWVDAFEKFGKSVTFDAVRGQIGKGGDQLLPVFLTEDEREKFGKECEEYRSRLFKEKYLPKVKPFDQVRDLFERLTRDGKKLALATSASGEELESYKKLLGISDLLDAETSKADAEKSKPHPDIFAAAMERLGNPDPSAVLVVGDTPYDVIAAKKLNLETICVLCGGFPEADLLEAGAAYLYEDVDDILSKYDSSPFVAAKADANAQDPAAASAVPSI